MQHASEEQNQQSKPCEQATTGAGAVLQAIQQLINPQPDHPLIIALTLMVAVGLYIVSGPLQRPWLALPCPILSQLLGS
jgi:hypothetical protein